VLCVALVVMVLSRQFLAMAENQRLYGALVTARDQLQHQALHDHLTQLPNRALFTDRLDHALRQPGAALGLLFCDLDDFKQVNDRYGHSGGDLVLGEVARRLLSCVRAGDTVARIGGDEFAILLESAEDTQQVADRVITSMRAARRERLGVDEPRDRAPRRGDGRAAQHRPGAVRGTPGSGRGSRDCGAPDAARGGPRDVRREDVRQGEGRGGRGDAGWA
jgi:diguanylate cyclase (GGDEF)-like protein